MHDFHDWVCREENHNKPRLAEAKAEESSGGCGGGGGSGGSGGGDGGGGRLSPCISAVNIPCTVDGLNSDVGLISDITPAL